MVEPLFWFAGTAQIQRGQTILLDGAEGKHAASVRRMRGGEAIQVSDGLGSRARGTVASVGQSSLEIEVREVSQDGAPRPHITLVQALAKGDRDEQAVQACTEAGIAAVVPWQAEHSVSRWDAAKSAKNVARWQTIATEAAKQSLRSWFPTVQEPVTSNQLVQSVGGYDLVLVLEPSAETAILDSVKLLAGELGDARIAIVIGPEGGVSPKELDQLATGGAKLTKLGSEVLRTSTAGVAAVAILQHLAGNW